MRTDPAHSPASPVAPAHGKALIGALVIILACLSFGCNSLFVKMVSARQDPWTISLVRFIVGTLLSVLFIAGLGWRRDGRPLAAFRVRDRTGMILRAVFGCTQMVLFFVGVAMTSSGRATLLMCTHPIFAALFGLLLFGERLPKVIFAGIVAGFAGAVVVFYDGSAYSLLGNLICLASAAANGMSMHWVKRVRREHDTFLVYLAPCLLGLAITAFAFPRLLAVTPADLAVMVGIGGMAFLGQVLMAWGLKYIPATTGSMLGLTEIIFAISLSAAFLGETMLPRFFLGAGIILAGLVLTGLVMNLARRRQAG